MPMSRQERVGLHRKQERLQIKSSIPTLTDLREGVPELRSTTEGLVQYITYKGQLYKNVLKSVLSEDGDIRMNENKKIYFDTEDTYIYANTDNPEDLVIGANQDIILEPDNNVGIANNNPGSMLEISKVSGQPSLELSAWSTTATAAHAGVLKFQKSGTAAVNTFTAGNHTTSGEILGRIEAYGVDDADGATLSSYIEFANDAVSDADSSPGKITFATSDADDAGTPTVRMIIDDGGKVFINDTSNAFMTYGLTINTGTIDTEALAFKSSDVSHGMGLNAEADTYGTIKKFSATKGGMKLIGYNDAGDIGIALKGQGTTEDNVRGTGATASVSLDAAIDDGSNSNEALSADKNMVVFRNLTTAKFVFDSDGDAHCLGTSGWTAFSDIRLKTDIETIPYGLAELLQLKPKRFKKSSGSFDESGNVVLDDDAKVGIGFMAQEVKDIIPEMIKDVDESRSFYSMNDGQLTSVLVKAVQELTARVVALENP